MIKPSINWDHVSPSFHFLAVDEDGTPWLYKKEPSVWNNRWVSGAGLRADTLSSLIIPDNLDWKQSLIKRPEEAWF